MWSEYEGEGGGVIASNPGEEAEAEENEGIAGNLSGREVKERRKK